jgi:hypothetical protein
MPIPNSYTEKTLAEYMHLMLGKVAKALDLHLGPNDAGDYAEAVNDALLAYGTDTIATITGIDNLQKLRALARVAAWQYVINNFAALYDFSADGASYNRSQLLANAEKALAVAIDGSLPYLPTYQAKIVAVDHRDDPYRYRPEDESGM